MATVVTPGNLTFALEKRIQDRLRRFAPDDPRLKETLLRIGNTIEAQAKINIRSQKLIDTGRLLNSIRHEFFRIKGGVSVTVGSFGVPYAAVHEFGFKGRVTVMEHLRTINQAFGNQIDPRVVRIREHQRRMNIPARPYLIPAVKKHTDKFIDMMRNLVREGLSGNP